MRLISGFLALALTTSAALAADLAPLTPGAPAGVKHAQMSGNMPLYIGIGVAAAVGIGLAASSGNDASPVAPTITTTLNTTAAP